MLSLDQLEERIGYAFQNKKLLDRARTHRSFSADHNERLEFLGDSVLNCVIGNALFLRDRHFTEGDLSRVRANLVCEKMLNTIGRRVGVSDFLRMGEGEMRNGGAERPSIIADAMDMIADEDGYVFMGELGNLLIRQQPDFDPRNYGFSKLTQLIKSIDRFEVDVRQTSNPHSKHIYLRDKKRK